jgi:hypothetical protein
LSSCSKFTAQSGILFSHQTTYDYMQGGGETQVLDSRFGGNDIKTGRRQEAEGRRE